jgi:hypothetical protein
MDHVGRKVEDSAAENSLNYDSLAQEVSEGKNISKWPKYHPCDFLAKHSAAFCSDPKNLPEAKLKSFELMALAEISR